MPLNTITMEVTCKHCQETATIAEHVMTNHRKIMITKLSEQQFQLPKRWMSMEWWSRAQEGAGYPQAYENVLDEGDFCSIECVIKYFQKRRRQLIKQADDRAKELAKL